MRTVPVRPQRRLQLTLGVLLSALAALLWAWGAVSHAAGPKALGICESPGEVARVLIPRDQLRVGFCDVATRGPQIVDLSDTYRPAERLPLAYAQLGRVSVR